MFKKPKILKNSSKIWPKIQKYPKFYPNTQITIFENVKIYPKPKSISENLNPKKYLKCQKYTKLLKYT